MSNKFFQSSDFKELNKLLKNIADSNKEVSDSIKSQTNKLVGDIGKSIKSSMSKDYANIKTSDDAFKFLKDYNLKDANDVLSIAKDLNEELNLSVHSIGDLAVNFRKALEEQKNLKEFTDKYDLSSSLGIESFLLDLSKITDNEEACDKMVKNFNRALEEMERNTEKSSKKITDHFGEAADLLQIVLQSKLIRSLDSQSETLLETGNSLIKSTGLSSESTGNYRNFVTDIVKGLNDATGSKYNLNETYSDLAALAENLSINRIDTLKEITRPALLAYKSMNVSLETIAGFSSKLYEFAGVDSLKMEGLVDYVRTISKNMNVNEQKIFDNMNSLSDTVLAFSNKYGLSADEQLAIYESISKVSTEAESSGINSSIFFSDLKEFLDNPYGSKLSQRLGILGINNGDINKTINDILSGNIESIFNQYKEGIAEQVEKSIGGLGSTYLNEATLSETDYAYSIYNALKSGVMDDRVKELYDNLKNPTKAVDNVKDQRISLTNKVINELSTQTSLLTDIKEKIGIGFDDVLSTMSTFLTIKGLLEKFGLTKAGKTAAKTATEAAGKTAAGSAASKVLGTATKTVPLAAVIASQLLQSGSSQSYEKTWLEDLERGINSGYNGDELYNYMLENTNIGTDQTSDLKTGKLLTKEQQKKIAMDEFNIWYNQTMKTAAEQSELLSSDEFLNNLRNALESQAKDGKEITEKFLKGAMSELGTSDVVVTQKILSQLLNNAYGGGYQEPIMFAGSYANKSIDKFINQNLPEYSIGSNYISHDQLALLHEGEAVVPKEYNPAANVTELETLRNQSRSNNIQNDENVKEMVNTLAVLVNRVESILTTFNEYAEESDRRYKDNKLETRINTNRMRLTGRVDGISPSLLFNRW